MPGAPQPEVPWYPAFMQYVQMAIYIMIGHVREWCGMVFGSRYASQTTKRGFAPLLVSWENFYTNRVYHRLQDAFNHPVSSAPGAHLDIIERYSPDGNKTFFRRKDGRTRHCLNLGSYNYLGFADDWMNTCSKTVMPIAHQNNIASTTSAMEFGTTAIHRKLETAVARFLGKEAAIVYSMGYNTNAASIPALMGKGSLIISDTMNHSSIVNGARASGASIAVFRHNDAKHLESTLRAKIVEGQPRTHRAWKKIMVMVEGVYSMEGEILDLRSIVDVCKKYHAYIYVDEAHSIGALGKTGRGVCEYNGVDTKDIDILMGTFTKSFAAMGGYIAASKEVIDCVRASSLGCQYGPSMPPVVAQQALTALNIIAGLDGTKIGEQKLTALRENSNYFRQKMIDMGTIVLGDFDSPVVPVMLYQESKIREFALQCLERDLAVVTVGFPATALLLARVRFCISAGHTREDLDDAAEKLREVIDICHCKYKTHFFG